MEDISVIEAILMICFYIISILFSAIGREILFGLMALKYGDETPKKSNRITLNPLKHIDIFGIIIIPLTLILIGANFMFGYAKPMPVNFDNIEKSTGIKGCLYVSLSGTFFNFLVALSVVSILKLGLQYKFIDYYGLLMNFLLIMLQVNILLAIFNLLPIPPLSGALILAYLGLYFNVTIFARWYNNLEKYGIILIILILLLPPTREIILWVIQSIFVFFLKL